MADMDEYLNDLIKFRQKLHNGINKYEMNGFSGDLYDNNNEEDRNYENVTGSNSLNTNTQVNGTHHIHQAHQQQQQNHDSTESNVNFSPDITKRLLRLPCQCLFFSLFVLPLLHIIEMP